MNTKQLDLDVKTDIETKVENMEELFPFENKFAKVEKLEEEVIRKVCPLCGLMKDLEYAKTNSGYIQKICKECAIKYVKWWNDKVDE